MKKFKRIEHFSNINPNYDYAKVFSYIPKHALFFDIETTGFSPSSSRLYLIGVFYFSGFDLIIEQFFAQSDKDEPSIFAAFFNLAKQFDTLISYHGTGFDLPFLKGLQQRLKLDLPQIDTNKNQVDLYQLARSFRHLLLLSNYKQMTLEDFIGCKRTGSTNGMEQLDAFSGGDLIPVYQHYLKQPDDTLLKLLLQHNYEDLTGMAALLSLYAYQSLLDGQFAVTSCSLQTYKNLDGMPDKELIISSQLEISLPAGFSCSNGLFYLCCTKDTAVFRIPVYEGTLKYFYPNYKDYYYLPDEDTALHKSVAAYVDKAHRKQAAASTCYTKKAGMFLPQYEEVQTPALFVNYKDRISYFELTEDFSSNLDLCRPYCMHILHQLQTGNKATSHPL